MARHKSEKGSYGRGSKGSKAKKAETTAKTRRAPSNTAPHDHDNENLVTITEMTVQEKCDLIAEISESVLEDPSTAFSSTKEEGSEERMPSKIRRLLDLATTTKNGSDEYTCRLAIMSLLALFQDVLPSYRIRLPTAAEMAVRVTKETKQMWDYEKSLLSHYQQYLKLLERTWEQSKGDMPSPLSTTAILSLCELLKSAFHFNFRSNILALVVRQMNNKQCQQVGDACCNSVAYVLKNDAQGDVALEATRLVAKMIRDCNFRVRSAVLRTFVSLPLRVHIDEAQAAKLAAAANAKKRKRNREEASIENEMKEGSSSVDKIVLARSQSDTLQAVTVTYFRILKSTDLTTEHIAELLPPALEGLAKFAHLINFETVVDLLGVLKTLLKRVDELPLDASLNCILTAFQTLQGPGREMKIDQKEYITPLYSQLPRYVHDVLLYCMMRDSVWNQTPLLTLYHYIYISRRLCTEVNGRNHTDLALQCLNAAFIKRREYSTVRIAAFVKQLCTVALHAPAHTSAPLLAFVRQLTQRYPSIHQMLENEQDVITSGEYNPDVNDPEHSNPFATSVWELATLSFHVDPKIAHHANGAACQKMLQLPFEAPERVRKEMLRDTDELYISNRRVSKKHPLAGKGGGDKRHERFISARARLQTCI